jgi:hypothetical protein
MLLLVDHDNLSPALRARGAVFLSEHVLQMLGLDRLRSTSHVTIRLYGGWYEDRRLTSRAQVLAAELATFPRIVNLVSPSRESHAITVRVELAYSMLAEPARNLMYTVRVDRGLPASLRCAAPRDRGCRASQCPLAAVQEFFTAAQCPEDGCFVTPNMLFSQAQQKLVDTLLAVDLVHAAQRGDPVVSLLTSDDDVWPAIRSAMLLGSRVLHMTDRARYATEYDYVDRGDVRYDSIQTRPAQ